MSTRTAGAGELLAERLGLNVLGREGHDLKAPCIACDSSDAFRIERDAGVAHCYACQESYSPLQLAETVLGDRDEAWRLLEELGLSEPRGHHSNGRKAASPACGETLEQVAREKGVTAESLKAYGAINDGGDAMFPMFGPDGTRCSTFRITPGLPKSNKKSKGTCAKGKPVGLFLPADQPQAGQTWLIVEGVKDAAALFGLGYPTAGLPSSTMKAEFARLFEGVHVVIVPDRDRAGERGAKKTGAVLEGQAASVRIAVLPVEFKQSNGDDVRDVLRKPDGEQFVRRAIADAKPWEAGAADEPSSLDTLEGQTEVANARRFFGQHGDDVRWCDPWGKWLIWDGRRWLIDERRKIEDLGKASHQQLWVEFSKLDREKQQGTLLRFVRSSGSARGIRAMLELARSDVSIVPDELDRDPWAFNVANGTIDLRTKTLRPHRKADFFSAMCPVAYDPNADCPTWFAFLRRITDGDDELASFLRRAVGFSMTADVREHVLFFLYGTGGNGKSVFLNTVESCFGPDYGMKAPRGLLMAKKETHPTELADLAGKRFISCIEAEDGHRLAESLVKEMTGGDGIRARRMREDFWQFKPTHKIWLAANHKPRIRGTDNGIWRRIRLVPFTVSIPEDQQDKELPAKLEAELPGILNWALLGCLEWQQNGLAAPDVVNRATAEYREEMDLVGGFIEECCIIAQCHKARAVDLYGAYQRWAEQAGEHPASQRAFGTALAARGFERKSSNGTWYLGIGMATAAGNETEPFT